MGMAAILVMWPGQFIQTFIPPSQGCSMWSLTLNGQALSKKKMSEHCERTTTTTTTDARALVYYKLTFWAWRLRWAKNWTEHDKTNKMTCAPSEDSDQPGHPPSLIRVFTVCMKKAWILNYLLNAQWRLWSDWANAQADLSLRWVHRSFCWFCHDETAQLLNASFLVMPHIMV